MYKKSLFLLVMAIPILFFYSMSAPKSSDSNQQRILKNNPIDTITIITDALVAIDNYDFYSVSSSCMLDTLLTKSVARCLRAKGYKTNVVPPLLMGSFMDSILAVPIGTDSISFAPLPFHYNSNYTSGQLDALHRIYRRLYLRS
jgi:hypothetical protein